MAVLSTPAGERARADERAWTSVFSSRWMLAVILALTFGVFAPTLGDWFTGDDFWFLHAGQTNDNIFTYVGKSFDPRNTGQFLEFDRYRPLYPIAWRLEYAAFGLNATAYHAVVIGLHLTGVVLLWFVARRLFAEAWAANLATLIFAVHPAYADAIAWISGANRVFEGVPYLAALLLFMKYREDTGRARAWCYAGSLAAFIVSVLFHSSALPLALVLAAYVFVLQGEPQDALAWRRWLPFVPFFAVVIGETGLQYWVRGHLGAEEAYRWGFHQYANYGQYFAYSLEPITTSGHHGLALRLLNLAQGLASLTMLGITAMFLLAGMRSRLGLFAVIWYWASLLPDSTLVLGSFGRTMYVPGMALGVLLTAALIRLRDAAPQRVAAPAVAAAPFVLALLIGPVLIVNYGRNASSRDDAAENESWLAGLERALPSLPSGGTLYVTRAPSNLVLGDESRLEAMVQLHYGEVSVRVVTPAEAAIIEARAQPGERVYRAP